MRWMWSFQSAAAIATGRLLQTDVKLFQASVSVDGALLAETAHAVKSVELLAIVALYRT